MTSMSSLSRNTPDRPAGTVKNSTACLLLHGLATSPSDLAAMVPVLEGLGCFVDLQALPGHGGTVEEFRASYFPDWLRSAEDRLKALLRDYETVILVGFSMGASISLHLASRYAVSGAFLLAPAWQAYRLFPLRHSSWLALTPLLKYIRPVVETGPPRPESREIAPCEGHTSAIYLPQLHSLVLGLEDMRQRLPGVRCPVHMMYDLNDRVCPPEFATKIARTISSADVTIRFTRMNERITSHHMLPTHRDTKNLVLRELRAFIVGLPSLSVSPPI